ncbi:DMT family transporter [Amycolatopsis acidiphila]|uniref:DMT family transporter n=1 Tax=Amycolatopsis acidiphila TaxID=715473 RepID=A0A557ZYG0_9PSEU|nr:DMT family transporter [Amycolatopsis acidiphila]TVT17055.1 DMT family transporter [Amycolatopsis acidiphila]UIJ60774.1 DMT family transporter [Amycolatopsis acidiphila]GHG90922.1 multidrug transporter [Amycolatopsis acidiphila]
MGETKTLLRLGALALMWGSSFLWMKLALEAFTPVQLVLIRIVLGAVVLLVIGYFQRGRLPSDRRVWLHLAMAALFHNALPFLLFAVGEETVSSGITGVLNATTPLWTLVVALAFRVDRDLGLPRLAGLVLGLAGILVIFAPWHADGLLSWGALACVAAAVSYGFIYTYEGRFLSATGSSPVALAGAQMMVASGFVLFAMPAGGTRPVHLSLVPVLAVVVLGVFCTGIAFALNYRLLATESAVAVSTVGYLIPVVSVLLGTVFLHEELNPRVLVGMVIVLAGVALTRLRRRARVETLSSVA